MSDTIPRATAVLAAQSAADALSIYDALSEDDAAEFCDDFVDAVITRLRRDPRWVGVSPYDLDLLLADVRRQFSERLTKLIDGHVSARWFVREFRDALNDYTEGAP